jgi:hypothetical protein
MFHSSDRVAALPMAISKALSGGPVYLSDQPQNFVKHMIEPLCFDDGRLLRPIAPGAPVEEDIFYSPDENRLLRVIAPLRNASAAVAVFHLESNAKNLSTTITPNHYRQSASMIQPMPGPWAVPKEGLLLYDWTTKKAELLGERYEVTMSEFGVSLMQVSPIYSGWSVIGRIDKYLPAAAITAVSYNPDHLRFQIEEPGPLAIWSSTGTPHWNDKAMANLEQNLYFVEIPSNALGREVVLIR